MAEPFSIAASAFQVAGAGIKLANTLKSYTDSVRKAEKQLKPIADHVKLTADVLNNVGSLLDNDEIRSLYTKELLRSTNDALGGCRNAFDELDKFTGKLLRPTAASKASISITTTAKFTLYFKQKELDVLQAHLERFKSSLDLVLGVLNLASSARSAKDASAIASMKEDIQRLIQAECDAKKKEASILSVSSDATTAVEETTTSASQDLPTSSSTARSLPFIPTMSAMAVAGPTSRGLNLDSTSSFVSSDPSKRPQTPEDSVLQHLTRCAEAAAKLTADIEEAVSKLNGTGHYEPRCLEHTFQTTREAMWAIKRYELNLSRSRRSPPLLVRTAGHNESIIRREHRSSSSSSEYGRRRSRSRSRSRSNPPKPYADLHNSAVVGALAAQALKEKKKKSPVVLESMPSHRRSRSRRRRSSLENVSDRSDASYVNQRNRRVEISGLAAAATAGMLDRVRSKSRQRDRQCSRSRARPGALIASAGLGGAALAGLYERRKANNEAASGYVGLSSSDQPPVSAIAREGEISGNKGRPTVPIKLPSPYRRSYGYQPTATMFKQENVDGSDRSDSTDTDLDDEYQIVEKRQVEVNALDDHHDPIAAELSRPKDEAEKSKKAGKAPVQSENPHGPTGYMPPPPPGRAPQPGDLILPPPPRLTTYQPAPWAGGPYGSIPAKYAEYILLPPLPPVNQPLTSATYIPDGEAFGPGVGIPPLESQESNTDQSQSKQSDLFDISDSIQQEHPMDDGSILPAGMKVSHSVMGEQSDEVGLVAPDLCELDPNSHPSPGQGSNEDVDHEDVDHEDVEDEDAEDEDANHSYTAPEDGPFTASKGDESFKLSQTGTFDDESSSDNEETARLRSDRIVDATRVDDLLRRWTTLHI